MALLEVQGLKKIYTTRFGGSQVQALSSVSFSVAEGEYAAIMGESGSGKTTLLNILAALDKPTGGTVLLDGRDITKIKESGLAAFRRDSLGFVFQDFNLLDTFSLQDNIFLPLVLQGKSYEEMAGRIGPLARKLGISQLLGKYPYEVSGGENYQPSPDPGRRADRRAGFPRDGGAFEPLRRGERRGPDDTDGDPLGQGRGPRAEGALPARRRGLPPALPGRAERRAVLRADFRHADGHDPGR